MYNHPHQDRVDTNMEVEQQEREKQPPYVCMYITTVKGMKTSNTQVFILILSHMARWRGLSDTMDTWTMGPPVMATNHICNQLNMSIYTYGAKSTQAVPNDEFHHHEDKQSI